MNRLAPVGFRGVKTAPSRNLVTRLFEYARRNGLEFLEQQHRYELAWSHGATRYVIHIDKDTAAVRSGFIVAPHARARYHSTTYLGTAPLDELLDEQREFAEHHR